MFRIFCLIALSSSLLLTTGCGRTESQAAGTDLRARHADTLKLAELPEQAKRPVGPQGLQAPPPPPVVALSPRLSYSDTHTGLGEMQKAADDLRVREDHEAAVKIEERAAQAAEKLSNQ